MSSVNVMKAMPVSRESCDDNFNYNFYFGQDKGVTVVLRIIMEIRMCRAVLALHVTATITLIFLALGIVTRRRGSVSSVFSIRMGSVVNNALPDSTEMLYIKHATVSQLL